MIYFLLSQLNLFFAKWETLEFVVVRTGCAILTSFLISIIFGPWIIRKLFLMQIKQYIRKEGPESHYKKAGTPTMGGILIIFSLIISTIIWVNPTNLMVWIVLFANISFGMIGLIDDHMMQIKKHNKGLGAKQKILLQIIVAIIISYLIYLLPDFNTKLTMPFSKKMTLDLKWIYIFFSTFVIVGTSNAVNLADGLDGMAIGATTIAKTAYLLVILVTGYPVIGNWTGIANIFGVTDLAVYCGAFIGSGLGFLWFNSYPAQIFMGDVGSLSIGASLGTIAILTKHELLLILIGGFFVTEATSVILQIIFFKISGGQRILKMAPLHHHFELNGLSEPKIVVRVWIVAIILVFISFFHLI